MNAKSTLFGFALGCCVAAPFATQAGVNNEMERMFYANKTNPQVADGATRGVIDAGGVRLRVPIKTTAPISATPPQLNMGCGGIDAYGGNISFPSKQEFISMGRAIVGNIGGYAFKQALKTVCSSCEAVMSEIQQTVEALNFGEISSCQVAEAVVSQDKRQALADRARDWASNLAREAGDVSDAFEGMNWGKKSRAGGLIEKDEDVADVLQGNWTWKAMKATGTFDWLGTDRRTLEEIMSLLGTVIGCTPGLNGCTTDATDAETNIKILPPTLQLADFVRTESEAVPDPRTYVCNDSENCLNPKVVSNESIGVSPAEKMISLLLGEPGTTGEGMLDRLVERGTTSVELTPEQKRLSGAAPELVGMAVGCYMASEQGRGYARKIVQGLAPQIAAEYLAMGVDQSITLLVNDLERRDPVVGAGEAAERLLATQKEVRAQATEISRKMNSDHVLTIAVRNCAASPAARHVVASFR